MNARDVIKQSIESGQMVSMAYLADLSEQEMFHRPCPGANHINWQIGHLVVAEHGMVDKLLPGSMPPLPAEFAERYTKETATVDDPQAFCNKADLLTVAAEQRHGHLERSSEDERRRLGQAHRHGLRAECGRRVRATRRPLDDACRPMGGHSPPAWPSAAVLERFHLTCSVVSGDAIATFAKFTSDASCQVPLHSMWKRLVAPV